jgi:ATP-dependent helicase HrpA
MATEKVTVYGLPIVAARKVNYSQIDPALCRELFIRHALVEGDWQTRHAFFRENLKLRTKSKSWSIAPPRHSRGRRVLRPAHQPRCDLRAPLFDKWKKASKETPDLLNFEKSMLIKEGRSRSASSTIRTSGIRATSSCV